MNLERSSEFVQVTLRWDQHPRDDEPKTRDDERPTWIDLKERTRTSIFRVFRDSAGRITSQSRCLGGIRRGRILRHSGRCLSALHACELSTQYSESLHIHACNHRAHLRFANAR
jgi:hypothetical protein